MHKITDIQNIINFLYGGNATLTIKSEQTGKHLTFKVKIAKKDDDNSPYFVSVLSGPDNYSNYSYIGIITNKDTFRLTTKSKVSNDAVSYKAFNYFFNCIKRNMLHKDLSVFHEGKCARCGRKLTTPESILSGFGPECIKKSKKD